MLNVRADIMRYLDGAPPSARAITRVLFFDFGLQSALVYRLGRALLGNSRRIEVWPLLLFGWPVYFCLAFFVRRLYGIDLRLSADIGPGLCIGHYGGIRIMNCRIGAYTTIGEQVKVGSKDRKSGPVIGDRVWFGGHVHVSGPVVVGERVTLASGALIVQDVVPRALVVGRPGRVISSNYDNAKILGAGVPP
jgi:serine O-acetyltransferase